MTSPFGFAADLIDPPPNPYLDRPVDWIGDTTREQLWAKQAEIAEALVRYRKVAVQACHSGGKSWLASRLAGWWVDTHPIGQAFVVSTAPSYPQVHDILWEEIRAAQRLAEANDRPLPGNANQSDEWKVGTGIDATLVGRGRKPADTDEHGFQGIHRRFVLAVLDEACGIPKQLWTAVDAVTTGEDCRILAIGNPDDPTSEFAQVCKPGSGWHVIRIDGMLTPNISIETLRRAATEVCEPPLTAPQVEALLAEARDAGTPETVDDDRFRHATVSAWWIADKVRGWLGVSVEDGQVKRSPTPMWTAKVRGQFPDVADNALIPLSWIERAMERDLPPEADAPRNLTVDVARFGTDETVIGLREGGRLRLLVADPGERRTTVTSSQAATLHREYVTDEIRVDGIGVGSGVVDELVAEGLPVIDMVAGQAAVDGRQFGNARAEWYWHLRTLFEQDLVDIDDEQLADQLQGLRYRYDPKGRIRIESKDDMKARGLPSPDRADVAMMAFAPVALPDDEVYEVDHRVAISPY